jgi:hypothetical protein
MISARHWRRGQKQQWLISRLESSHLSRFSDAQGSLQQHELELWNYEYESVEIIGDEELEAKDFANELEFCRHSKPIQVVGLTEAATREQNPVSNESELLNDIKSDDGVEVVDLTEGGKKEQNLGAETNMIEGTERPN